MAVEAELGIVVHSPFRSDPKRRLVQRRVEGRNEAS
jgi:hypothetical protein